MSDLPDRPLPLLFQASGAVDKVIPEWFYERFNTSQQISVDPSSPSANNFYSTESSKLSRVVSLHCRIKEIQITYNTVSVYIGTATKASATSLNC